MRLGLVYHSNTTRPFSHMATVGVATLGLLAIALVPLSRLRAQEHEIGGPGSVAVLGDFAE